MQTSMRTATGDTTASNRPTAEAAAEENDDVTSDEDEVLEESPCGRWQKRKDEVTQKDVPGIDATYLAMDTEEGVEVVWNEMQFSERKKFRLQKSRLEKTFNNLTKLRHNNIVKFYKYWVDEKSEGPRVNKSEGLRVIFITEYMTSGSIGQFLRRSKKNRKGVNLKMWKRWCRQILYALSYLHACDPPITHGGLNCDTIFIQHNGLIKIGSVAPDTINDHVKTYAAPRRNLHYISPEYGQGVYTGVDIYAFGVCALEMASMELMGNGSNEEGDGHAPPVGSHDAILSAVEKLEDDAQKEFIRLCLTTRDRRRNARDLLLHPLIFEVHPLRIFAAHSFIQLDEVLVNHLLAEKTAALTATHAQAPERVMAFLRHADGTSFGEVTASSGPSMDVEKIVEETRDGLFPLTSIHLPRPPVTLAREEAPAVEKADLEKKPEDDNKVYPTETRTISYLQCNVTPIPDNDEGSLKVLLCLRFEEDNAKRDLNTKVGKWEEAPTIAAELVELGFISKKDEVRVTQVLCYYLLEARKGLKDPKGPKKQQEAATQQQKSQPPQQQQLQQPSGPSEQQDVQQQQQEPQPEVEEGQAPQQTQQQQLQQQPQQQQQQVDEDLDQQSQSQLEPMATAPATDQQTEAVATEPDVHPPAVAPTPTPSAPVTDDQQQHIDSGSEQSSASTEIQQPSSQSEGTEEQPQFEEQQQSPEQQQPQPQPSQQQQELQHQLGQAMPDEQEPPPTQAHSMPS